VNKVRSGPKTSLLLGKSKIADVKPDATVVFSFKFLDASQGQSFTQWENEGLLSKMLEKFKHYSALGLDRAFSDKFKQYGSFPTTSEFKHPPTVPEDATWASMHIQNKQCVIGHTLKNVFYIVFLDGEHKFYPSEKKNT
jgi:hypothetical protein